MAGVVRKSDQGSKCLKNKWPSFCYTSVNCFNWPANGNLGEITPFEGPLSGH